MKQKSKIKWWDSDIDNAFDIFFNKSTPDYKKEIAFNEILYPALLILVKSFLKNNNWSKIGLSYDEITQEVITYTIHSITNNPYKHKEGRSRSSYVWFVMNRFIWALGKKHKKRSDRFQSLDDSTNEESSLLDTLTTPPVEDNEDLNDLIRHFNNYYNYITPKLKGSKLIVLNNIKQLLEGKLQYVTRRNNTNMTSPYKSMVQNVKIGETTLKIFLTRSIGLYKKHLKWSNIKQSNYLL